MLRVRDLSGFVARHLSGRHGVPKGVVITPSADAALTLEQRLAQFDPARHGGEAMVSERIGAERW